MGTHDHVQPHSSTAELIKEIDDYIEKAHMYFADARKLDISEEHAASLFDAAEGRHS